MSLYNILFKENEDAMALLGMISCTRDFFMRYRDVNLNSEGDIITVTTRLGGGNRKDYKQVFTDCKKNPYYIRDYDDVFDNTYCYIDFKVPEKYSKTCKMMAPKEKQLTVGELFKKEIEDSKIPGSPAEKRMNELAEAIFGQIMSGDDSGINIIKL